MVYVDNAKIFDAQDMATSFASPAMLVQKFRGYDVHVIFIGTGLLGTFKVQTSNDLTYNPLLVVNWNNLADSSVDIDEPGDIKWTDTRNFKWMRVVYTRLSGTGSCDAYFYAPRAGNGF